MRGLMIIIPNENILDVPLIYEKIDNKQGHEDIANKFIFDNNLSDKYNYSTDHYGYFISSCGHVVIIINLDIYQSIVFLPKELSNKQIKILNSFRIKRILNKIEKKGLFSYSIMDNNHQEIPTSKINRFENMYNYINQNNVNEKKR